MTATTVTYIRQNRLNQPVVNNEKIAKAIERGIIQDREAMRARLRNWGRWMNRNNDAVIDRETGQIKVSMSGRVIEFAPFVEKSGYIYEAPEPVDDADAELIAGIIVNLNDECRTLIRQVYEHRISHKFLASMRRCSVRTIERRCADAVDALGLLV